jgi:hypothetical protein
MLGRRSRDGQPRSTSTRGVAVLAPLHAPRFELTPTEATLRKAEDAADAATVAARAADVTADQAAVAAQTLRRAALVAAEAAERAQAAAVALRTTVLEASGPLAGAQAQAVSCRNHAQPRAALADESSRSVRHVRATGSLSRVTRSKRTPWDELETVRRGVRAVAVRAGG